MNKKIDKIIQLNSLFWQYPVITEKEFYNQNKENPNYLGFPWATIIDKHIRLKEIYDLLKPLVKHNNYYTCCQHISFRELIPLFKHIGINTVYCCHKILQEDYIKEVKILPCPLYAVNIEDPKRNHIFNNIDDFVTLDRKYKYSFMGALTEQNTNNRKFIFDNFKNRTDTFIHKIDKWHFENIVYSHYQNAKEQLNINEKHLSDKNKYNEVLLNSRYSLCPRGSGPNTIRFWESLACGSIPILLSDDLELPDNKNKLWKQSIVRIKERNISKVDMIINAITPDEEMYRRCNCIRLYKSFKNNYKNNYKNDNNSKKIIHYCCNSYENNSVGGVARYDYNIKLAFPDRIFIQQKDPRLLELCNRYKDDDLIVITDNHLACDVPNDVNTILVHHGVAEVHAEREPSWNEYWKNLCCEGQKKMLYYRDPNTTKIISISQFCTDEFKRIYDKEYTKFHIEKVLHCSELNENRFKTNFNDNPNILGSWIGKHKGAHLINDIKKSLVEYNFNNLSVYIDDKGIDDFNKRKQDIYLENDVYLCLSLHEGNSYAALDALLCGLVVVSSDVGLFYKDVPDECFVKLDWKKLNDVEYVKSKIEYGWKNREIIARKGREWYMKNCRLQDWKYIMNRIVNEKQNSVYLFQQFYIDNNNERYEEIKYTLKKNVNNDIITKIILLNEKIYSKEEFGLTEEEMKKIVQINIGERLTYKIFIEYASKYNGYVLLSNSDIYFDSSLKNIFNSNLHKGKYALCQVRVEDDTKELYTTNFGSSQDSWLFYSKYLPKVNLERYNIKLGIPGCENKFAYFLYMDLYNLENKPYYIKTFHVHKSNIRNYSQSDRYSRPYYFIEPTY